MPYRRIAFAQGEHYHVYNRGSGHGTIFRDADNYLFALRNIKRYARELRISVIAYCLLPNHYHMLLRQDGEQAAGLLLQRVFNSYTKAVNKRYDRTGTLFEGRYQAVHIARERYLVHLCCYIHANPVKHGLVTDLKEWPYSNYLEWLGSRNGTLVDRAFIRAHFEGVDAYARLVTDYVADLVRLPRCAEAYLFEE
jgi:REP element-mobilizing transposase RayT